ncbi:hypothetical protein JZU46_00095 [bacterium]|nr:hypothetical protein [bacterium]
MDLTYEELELLIHKISVGKDFLFIDDKFITLTHPTNELKLKAQLIYEKKYNDAILSGLLPKKDLELLIKQRGLFDQKDEDKLSRLSSQIDAQKIVLVKTAKVKANQDRLNKIIQNLEAERSILLHKKYSKLYMSAETQAEEEMNQYLCASCVHTEQGDLFWPSYADYLNDRSADLKTTILLAFLKLIRGVDVAYIRFVARSTLWRIRYTTSIKTAEALFNVATATYTIDQLNLVYWSNYYENIYSMMSSDRPSDHVIEDDSLLDAFMADYYKELNNETSILTRGKKNKGSMSAFDSEEVIVTQSSELYHDITYDVPKEAQKIKDKANIKQRTKTSGG